MIQDLLLRWVVTALFVISAAECAYALVAHRRMSTHIVGHTLHLVMAVAMAVMAWPWGLAVPNTPSMLFFLAATVWFVIMTLAQSGHRLVNAYHAAMMLGMAWMYAVMGGGMSPTPADGVESSLGSGGHHGGSAGSDMAGMDMDAMASDPPFVTALNWLCTVGFAIAALVWLYLLVRHRADSAARPGSFFGIACQAMMAAGMAIMFGVML